MRRIDTRGFFSVFLGFAVFLGFLAVLNKGS